VNTLEKLRILGAQAEYDRCGCESGKKNRVNRRRILPKEGIYPAQGPGGRKTLLLKTLQSNECVNDCAYCASRCGRGLKRTRFAPKELAGVFFKYLQQDYVEGLFLSSAVTAGNDAMDDVLETVSLIRNEGFRGYVHTKILPGASRDQVKRAAELSTRLSINIEAPSKSRLSELSSQKDYHVDIIRRMKWIKREVERGLVPAGLTTQLIAGAGGENDREILETASRLYGRINLKRVYYSAFNPVPKTPLEGQPKTPSVRERRLYQADYLLRDYGFEFKELVFGDDGFMPHSIDPKMAYAIENKDLFPLSIEEASERELLTVPGIGPKTAGKIIQARKEGRRLRPLTPKKALSFLDIEGTRQVRINELF